MGKIFALGGAFAHIAAGTWPLITATAQNQAVDWLSVAAHVMGPGLLSAALAVAVCLAYRPPEVLLPIEQPDVG